MSRFSLVKNPKLSFRKHSLITTSIFPTEIVKTKKLILAYSSSSVNVIKTDYTKPSLVNALKGQDAVVSFLGFAGIAKQPELLEAAEEAGVKRFIPSEFGHNTAVEFIGELVPVLKSKR
jgi:hypothetical protein